MVRRKLHNRYIHSLSLARKLETIVGKLENEIYKLPRNKKRDELDTIIDSIVKELNIIKINHWLILIKRACANSHLDLIEVEFNEIEKKLNKLYENYLDIEKYLETTEMIFIYDTNLDLVTDIDYRI